MPRPATTTARTATRLAIVSFAAGSPDLEATQARLLANQEDIGDAIEPYYGRAAGDALTALLREHITGAVDLLPVAGEPPPHEAVSQLTGRYEDGVRDDDKIHAHILDMADLLSQGVMRQFPKRFR